MRTRRTAPPTALALVLLLLMAFHLQACGEGSSARTISVSLRSTDVYRYPTVSGDEEGARISVQASHYRISEVRRDAETNWVAVYVYQPAPGFVGRDHAEIDILGGSAGAAAPATVRTVALHFDVHN